MNKTLLLILSVSVIGTIIGFLAYRSLDNQDIVRIGSIQDGQSYISTTTRAWNGTELTQFTVLKERAGTLGSVVITGTGGQFTLYDATTTNVNLRTNNTPTSTLPIVSITASLAAGTYTFDKEFASGLLFEELGSVATATITWR